MILIQVAHVKNMIVNNQSLLHVALKKTKILVAINVTKREDLINKINKILDLVSIIIQSSKYKNI